MTQKQKEILDFIKQFVASKNYPPTVREIADAFGVKSSATIFAHLEHLEEQNFIRRDSTKPRAIEIVDQKKMPSNSIVQVPLIGTVAAGIPILAVQNIEEYIPCSASFLHGFEDCYALRVKGESMINAGIFPGDILLVNQQPTVENGEIAVALVDDSATVKRFFKEDGYYRLQPENDTMDPIIVDHVDILGKVIGLYRTI